MPPIDAVYLGLIAAGILLGVTLGWLLRTNRAKGEKLAINRGWKEQLEAQRLEHARLLDQNKGLMERVSHLKSVATDAEKRAEQLAESLRDAVARREDLEREKNDAQRDLDVARRKCRDLESDLTRLSKSDRTSDNVIKEKDEKIFRLSRELENWQQRVPPLVERYRVRDEEADRLEFELAEARERIHALESVLNSDQTRVEPVDPHTLAEALEASNDATDTTRYNSAIGPLRDDLKRIKGIGPAIEKTLNDLGIYRFSQIAGMSEVDIDRVASRLKGFRSRIYREDWIGQARELQQPDTAGR